MTLIHSLNASRAVASRSAWLECWPEGTVQTPEDVFVGNASLVEAARLNSTPVVRIGRPGGLWKRYGSSAEQMITVVLTRVENISHPGDRHGLVLWVDADLDRCRPNYSQARLIGRRSSVQRRRMELSPHPAGGGVVRLPADIGIGDLIVIPCDGLVSVHEVGGSNRSPEPRGDDQGDDDGFPRAFCGR